MYSPTVYLSLVVLLHIPNVASAADVNGKVGERKLIPCKITGTYVLPQWVKDASISIANQGVSLIHPDYTARFSYDSDQRTLIVDPVQLSDTGSYVCTHSGGDNSPQTTTVEIKATTTAAAPTTTNTGSTYNDEPLLTQDEKVIVIVVSCIIGVILILAVVIGIAANAQRKRIKYRRIKHRRIKHRRSRRSSHGASRGHSLYQQDQLSERDLYDQNDIVYPYWTSQYRMPNRPYIIESGDCDDAYNRYEEVYLPQEKYYEPYGVNREPHNGHGYRTSYARKEPVRKQQGKHTGDRQQRRGTHELYPYISHNKTYTRNSEDLFNYSYDQEKEIHRHKASQHHGHDKLYFPSEQR